MSSKKTVPGALSAIFALELAPSSFFGASLVVEKAPFWRSPTMLDANTPDFWKEIAGRVAETVEFAVEIALSAAEKATLSLGLPGPAKGADTSGGRP